MVVWLIHTRFVQTKNRLWGSCIAIITGFSFTLMNSKNIISGWPARCVNRRNNINEQELKPHGSLYHPCGHLRKPRIINPLCSLGTYVRYIYRRLRSIIGSGFDTRSGNILSFLLPLNQDEQLSVTGVSMCTKYWLTA